jgi:hypothetical protein
VADIDVLIDLIAVLFPERHRPIKNRRHLKFNDQHEVGLEDLDLATAVLSDPRSDGEVDLQVALEFLSRIEHLGRGTVNVEHLRSRVIEHVERRWPCFSKQLAECAIENYRGRSVLQYFPRLWTDPHFHSQLARSLRNQNSHSPWLAELLSDVAINNFDSARFLIAAAKQRDEIGVSTSLFGAIARAFGWTPWVSLLAILMVRPDYAECGALFETDGDETRESNQAIAARLEMARALETQKNIRAVAGMLRELTAADSAWNDGGLLARPAETRAAYVDSLRALIGDDMQIRQGVIEALLWLPVNRSADLAQFAAVAIAEPEDRVFLVELERHAVRLVGYAARAVRAAKFGDRLEIGELPTPSTVVQSLVTFETAPMNSDEPARTWLGDRNIERLIEYTIARVEARVASEYDDHGDEGEDRLLSSLFRELALRFSDLDVALEAMARAASAPYRAAVGMRYRNVDRPEEGSKGVKGAKSFSADLCLIVDPILDGTSLGRRVTLIQAKRLYRKRNATKQPTWHRSFRINRDQRLALQAQTHSSVYFFFAPPLGGRGVPVIPTQLVSDLAEHKSSGTQLRKEVVAVASRSLSDWLTYDALALRVGDPHQALVEKAGGEAGSLPRRLLDLPTVEVDIALVQRSDR